jgi:hypothetical protein
VRSSLNSGGKVIPNVLAPGIKFPGTPKVIPAHGRMAKAIKPAQSQTVIANVLAPPAVCPATPHPTAISGDRHKAPVMKERDVEIEHVRLPAPNRHLPTSRFHPYVDSELKHLDPKYRKAWKPYNRQPSMAERTEMYLPPLEFHKDGFVPPEVEPVNPHTIPSNWFYHV